MFRWHCKTSDVAAATMVVARVWLKRMNVDQAINETLRNGRHCTNPDEMPETERDRFRLLVEEKLQKAKESTKHADRFVGPLCRGAS